MKLNITQPLKKEWNTAICSNMDGPRDYYTKWSKPDREKQIFITYMWNLKYIYIYMYTHTQMFLYTKQKQKILSSWTFDMTLYSLIIFSEDEGTSPGVGWWQSEAIRDWEWAAWWQRSESYVAEKQTK